MNEMSPDTILTVGMCFALLAVAGWFLYHWSLIREIDQSKQDFKNLKKQIHCLTPAQIELIKTGKCADCQASELWTTAAVGFSSSAQCSACGSKFRVISPIERIT